MAERQVSRLALYLLRSPKRNTRRKEKDAAKRHSVRQPLPERLTEPFFLCPCDAPRQCDLENAFVGGGNV